MTEHWKDEGLAPEPSLELLESLVSQVSECVFGLALQQEPGADDPELRWRAAALTVPGRDRQLCIAISSDRANCERMAVSMLSCAPEQLDQAMIEDVLCELVNVVGGHLKAMLGVDEPLSLPKLVSSEDRAAPWCDPRSERVALGDGRIRLCLWLGQGPPR